MVAEGEELGLGVVLLGAQFFFLFCWLPVLLAHLHHVKHDLADNLESSIVVGLPLLSCDHILLCQVFEKRFVFFAFKCGTHSGKRKKGLREGEDGEGEDADRLLMAESQSRSLGELVFEFIPSVDRHKVQQPFFLVLSPDNPFDWLIPKKEILFDESTFVGFLFFPLLSSSFFFFLLSSSFSFLVADGTQGLPDQGHKERKRRKKWRKRAKLLLSPFPSFLPTMSIKILECSSLKPVGRQQVSRAARLRRCRRPTSCKEWTNVSGRIRTQKNTCQNLYSPSSQLALPTLFLVSLFF